MNTSVRRSWTSGLVIAAVALAIPIAAAAQACLGSPAGPGQVTLRGEVGFPDEATSYGGTAMYRLPGSVRLFATFAVTDPDLEGLNNVNSVGGGVAFDVVPLLPELPPAFSICPVVGVGYAFTDQSIDGFDFEVRSLAVPIGIGMGTTIPVAGGAFTLTPYLLPQFVWSRDTWKLEGESESESETFFAGTAGVSTGLGPLLVGGSVARRLEEGFKTVFGVHLGLVF